MVKRDGIDDAKVLQVVHVRDVIAVPGDYVKRTVILHRLEEAATVFIDHCPLPGVVVVVLEEGGWRLEISRICQSIGSYRPQIGDSKMAVVDFEDVTSGNWSIGIDTKSHALLDDANAVGLDVHATEFCLDLKTTQLRDD